MTIPQPRREAYAILSNLRDEGYDDARILDYIIGEWLPGADALEAMEDFELYEL